MINVRINIKKPPSNKDETSLTSGAFSPLKEGKNKKNQATTYSPTVVVPSALRGLTSVFGMGTGGSPSLWSPGIISCVIYSPEFQLR